MINYDLVFVLLNYNTVDELYNFLVSTKENLSSEINYHIVCVDNYSNKENLENIIRLKNEFKFDLIENQNSGYGHGNNLGIDYAMNNYQFNYLIVSNCDIRIDDLKLQHLNPYCDGIIAPQIINNSKKNQNPMYLKKHRLIFKLFNLANKFNSIFIFNLTIVLSKIFYVIDKCFVNDNKVFACHGSFIIFPYNIIKNIFPVFDSDMFLLCEEIALAEKAKIRNINVYYLKDVKIRHFEDASMGEYNTIKRKFNLWQQSYSIYYEKYFT